MPVRGIPSPSLTPALRDPESTPATVTVKAGDTLWKIARRLGLSLEGLIEANPGLTDPDRIRPGQVLTLPTSTAAPITTAQAGGVAVDDVFSGQARAGATLLELDDGSPAGHAAPAMPSAETMARSSPPSTRLPGVVVRAIDTEVFRQASAPHAAARTVRLGDVGDARVALESTVTPGDASAARSAFATDVAARRERAVFATTRGALDVTLGPDATSLVAGGVGFTLDRPYVLKAGSNQGVELATAMVKGSTDELPLSASKALALPPTSRFTLDGHAATTPVIEGAAGQAAAKASVAASVDVERGQGSLVKVTLTRRADLEAAASSTPLEAGEAGLSLQAAREEGRSTQATYTLDLETPAGRRAYESLIAFRAGPADALVDDHAPGVTRGEVRHGSTRAQTAGGQARVVGGDTSLEVGHAQSRRRERDLSGSERAQTSSSTSAAARTSTRGVVLGLGGARSSTTDLTTPVGGAGVRDDVPRSAQAALLLPEGSTWRLTSDARGNGSARRSEATVVEESRDRALTIDVTRRAGSTVQIEATRNDNVATSLTRRTTATPTRAGIDVSGGREAARSDSFRATLDLALPEHRAAYESLLRGEPAPALVIARAAATATEETRLAQHASVTATAPDTAPVTGRATLSWKRDVTTQGPEGARIETGSLLGDATLTTTMGDVTVGLTPGRTSSYELVLPAGARPDLALPTDAEKARVLPSGARFTLEGEGRLGASAAVGAQKADVSEAGKVRVDVVRGDDDTVELRARVTTERRSDVDGTLAVGRTEGPQVQLTGSQRRQRERGHELSVSLDLARPADRAAYDAALRGDVAPARQLVAARTTTSSTTATATTIDERSAQQEAGVALKNLAGVTVVGRVSREVLPASDLRIAFDEDRRATSEALLVRGRSTEWQELKARGALGADLRKEIPLATTTSDGAPQSVGLGFSSGKSVSIRVFAPVADHHDQKLAVPTAAADVLALSRGTEVELTGEGSLGTTVKAVMGGPLATAPGLVLAGTVSASASQTKTDRFSVNVRRGEGSSATVSITDASLRAKDTEVGMRVGLTVDPTALIGAGVTSSLPALAQKPIEGALGKVGEAINDKASIALSHTTKRRATHEHGLELRFEDLTEPAAAAAYAEAVQGRPEAALALAERARAGERTGVKMVRGLEVTSTSSERRTSLTAGGGTLFLREALRQDSTQIVRDDGGTDTTQTSSYREKSRSLLGERKEVLWEAVSVRTSDDTGGQRFYRMTFDRSDPLTSRGDLARVQRMAEDLGATPARPIRADAQGGLASAVGAAMGKTRTQLEVFVTPKGMDAVRGATKEQALLAYGKAAASSEGAATVAPWANVDDAPKARALLEQYERLRNEPRSDGDDPSERVRLDYWFSYRRNIWDDTGPYKRATAFAASVERLGHSSDPGEWNKAFADVGKGTGFHVTEAVSAMNILAGADEILVHRLKMSGSRVDLEMVDEGLRERPTSRALPVDPGHNPSAF